MATSQLDKAYEIIRSLSSDEQQQLFLFIASLVEGVDDQVSDSWTDEELQELMKPNPMSGKDIVESGWLGGWEHK